MTLSPPRCLGCGYFLLGLPELICPECGRPFDLSNPTTFSAVPLFNRFRFWLPGYLLAMGMGVVLYSFLILFIGFGFTVSLVLPLCLGALIGYSCRVSPLVRILLAISLLGAVLIGLFTLQLVGVFCGLTLAAVAFGPLLFGAFLGWALRFILKSSAWDQRWHLPTLLVSLVILLCGAIEARVAHPYADETVDTTLVLPVSVDRAWDALMFYEEVHATPPILMRFALPRPLFTRGSTEHVGDLKVCIYSKGRLTKRVSRRVPDSVLTFNVVEQNKIENRSVVLKSGRFQFERPPRARRA